MGCPFCENSGETSEASLIHDFGDFRWIVGDHQFYPGYSLLVARRHVREPFELETAEQRAMTDALTRAARAIQKAYGPRKLNYAAFGNQVEHLHWHLFPRYEGDPHGLAGPWANEARFSENKTTPALAREVAKKLLEALD